MTALHARRRWVAARLAAAGLLATGVTAALYRAGRLHQPDYAFSLFGTDPFPAKSLLATIALGLAGLQVLLALWLYRRLPLAPGPPRAVPTAHRVTGLVLFALTVPVAAHCLIAYGVQLSRLRVAIHSLPAASSTACSPPRSSWCAAGGCPDGRSRPRAGHSR